MNIPETELLSAFDNGIRRIFCKHSKGTIQTGNASPGIHQHREILFVLQGENTFPLNHNLLKIKAGDVVLIDRWVAHCANYTLSDRNLRYLWFYIFPDRLTAQIHQIDGVGNKNDVLKWVKLASDLNQIINRRWDEFSKLPPDLALSNVDRFMKEPLHLLIDELCFYLYKMKLQEKNTQGYCNIVDSIQHIIEANNGRNCSLAYLEKYTGFNRFYISHLFKKAHGISIGEYINNTRLKFYESARALGMKHKQIAFELGFLSASSLSTWVHKIKAQKK